MRKSKRNGRMPISQAAQVWRRKRLTTAEVLARMPGWNEWTAYRYLGKRGAPLGRRRRLP